jgi:hypothetical protein
MRDLLKGRDRESFTNRQLESGNRQWRLPGPIFCRIAIPGRQGTALITLSQLSARTALQTLLVGTETGATADWQHAFDFNVRPRDNMHADQLTYSASGSGACVRRSFYSANIAAHKDRDITSADILFTQKLHVRGLHHRISRFDRAYEAFGFHHA